LEVKDADGRKVMVRKTCHGITVVNRSSLAELAAKEKLDSANLN